MTQQFAFTQIVIPTDVGEEIAIRRGRDQTTFKQVKDFLLHNIVFNDEGGDFTVIELSQLVRNAYRIPSDFADRETMKALRALARRGAIVFETVPSFAPFRQMTPLIMQEALEGQSQPIYETEPLESIETRGVITPVERMFFKPGTPRRVGVLSTSPDTREPLSYGEEV